MSEPINQSEAFLELMNSFQPRLYGYILSLIGNPDLANDVLQETNLVLWKKSGEFQTGTSFRAWSFRVAHFQVMAQRQRQIRDKLLFDDELLLNLEKEAKAADDSHQQRNQHLTACIEKLNDRHRELVRLRYGLNLSVKDIAAQLKLNANAITQTLFRARSNLIDCVQQTHLNQG